MSLADRLRALRQHQRLQQEEVAKRRAEKDEAARRAWEERKLRASEGMDLLAQFAERELLGMLREVNDGYLEGKGSLSGPFKSTDNVKKYETGEAVVDCGLTWGRREIRDGTRVVERGWSLWLQVTSGQRISLIGNKTLADLSTKDRRWKAKLEDAIVAALGNPAAIAWSRVVWEYKERNRQ